MASNGTRRHRHSRDTSRSVQVQLMAELFGMLSDPSRLQILICLQDRAEVCVGDLSASTGVGESALSHALRLLRAHGIVKSRRDGRRIFYSLADEHVGFLVDATTEHFEAAHVGATR